MSKQSVANSIKIHTFPAPPLSEALPDASVNVGDTVVVVKGNKKRFKGVLERFDPVHGLVEASVDGKPVVVKLSDIKIMHLPRLRKWTHNKTLKHQQGMYLPAEAKPFQIVFKDGDELKGETLGFHSDRNGFYVFPTQKGARYICVFVAHAYLAYQHIGPRIGEILVKDNKVTNEQLATALDEQKEHREQPLGDYLKNKAILTTSELDVALAEQKKLPHVKLGTILLDQGIISDEQLNIALKEQSISRNMPLGRVLVKLGMSSEAEIQQALARKLGIPYVDLVRFKLDLKAFDSIPEELARQARAVVLHDRGNKLVVAVSNPLDWGALEMVSFATGKSVEAVMAAEVDIIETLNLAYSTRGLDELHLDDIMEETQYQTDVTDEVILADHIVVKLVNKLIIDAQQLGASDIHIEPQSEGQPTRVRMRRDGVLRVHTKFPAHFHRAVSSRIKVMANLDSTFSKRPQDGKIDFARFSALKLEVRVATLPTIHGIEDVIMRLLPSGGPVPLAEMNFDAKVDQNLRQLIHAPHGMLLVCGPTGSGKTTTLHSILAELNTDERKILTVEDPVEITQKGLTQVPIDIRKKMTYEGALRSILRSDPDVIMIGEIRDKETAHSAIEASLTGHLVLSTLHTNSAPETVVRLLEMGMDPFNYADALLGVLSQRLVQTLCLHCRESYVASETDLIELSQLYCADFTINGTDGHEEANMTQRVKNWREQYGREDGSILLNSAKGCAECDDTGYAGRVAVHELLRVTPDIRALVVERATVAKIAQLAMNQGMCSLRQDGIDKVLSGVTTLDHVRVLSANE